MHRVVRGDARDVHGVPPLAGVADEAHQVLGRLTDLPVAVLEGAFEGGDDLGSLERSKGQDRTSPDRRLVLETGEHGVSSVGMADRSEGGNGGLPAERVVVGGGDAGEGVDRAFALPGPLAGHPAGDLHDRRVGVVEQGGGTPVGFDAKFERTSPDLGSRVVEGRVERLVGQGGESGERSEGGGTYDRFRVVEQSEGGSGVSGVAGGDGRPSAVGGLAVGRGSLVEVAFGHRSADCLLEEEATGDDEDGGERGESQSDQRDDGQE